jgi:hypothetical protein
MTEEKLLTRYKIHRHNQRAGSVYFSVRKRRGKLWWYTAYKMVQCGLADSCREKLYWKTYEEALKWVREDVTDRFAVYNSGVVTIDKFEPLVRENKYLKELTELLEVI